MVDSWLVAHALPPGITTTLHNVEETDESAGGTIHVLRKDLGEGVRKGPHHRL